MPGSRQCHTDEQTALSRRAYGDARVTVPRLAVAEAAEAARGAFTVEELAELVRRDHPEHASPATVYRAVAAMVSAGYLERVGVRAGSGLFARCHAAAHHHHIVCDGCGRTVEADCPLGQAIEGGAATHGFTITRHEVTLYGLCPACGADGTVC